MVINKRGFTLIELLISVAILGIVAGVGGDLLLTSIRSYNRAQILNTLSQNGDFALSNFKNEVQNAQSVAFIDSSTLTIVNQAGNTVTYSLSSTAADCSGGNGSFSRNADTNSQLLNSAGSSATVHVNGGSNFSLDGNLVTVTLVLAQACGSSISFDSEATTTLRTSVLVRGAYR